MWNASPEEENKENVLQLCVSNENERKIVCVHAPADTRRLDRDFES